VIVSKRARAIQASPIRKLAAVAAAAKKRGISVYHLNIGQPDIATPEAFMKEVREFSDPVLSYGPSDGLPELKEAMVDYFARYDIDLEKEQILITTGGSEAISFALSVVADPGDEVIVFEPFYTNYNGYATLANVDLVPVTTLAADGFHLPGDEEIRSRITPRTRALLICSPNNPTGTVFSETEIRRLAEIARQHNLYLIADEVYKEFTYDGLSHFSVLELAGMADRVIVVDSISKRFSACGARIGAVISRNNEVMGAVMKFAQARLCPPTLEQIGAIGAYSLAADYFDGIRAEYQKRRDILYSMLTARKGVVLRKPEGAFYLMAGLPVKDADRFATWLLTDFSEQNETVMLAPGNGFYYSNERGQNEVRIAYVLETTKLERAAEILIKALDRFQGSN